MHLEKFQDGVFIPWYLVLPSMLYSSTTSAEIDAGFIVHFCPDTRVMFLKGTLHRNRKTLKQKFL